MQKLAEIAHQLGIDAVRITTAEPFSEMAAILSARKSEGLYPAFVDEDIARRVDPKRLLPQVKSIISVAVAYKSEDPAPIPHLHGAISRYAWGLDYHTIMYQRIEKLIQYLKQEYGVQHAYSGVDTRPPIDRAIALRAGLGYLGHNCGMFVPPFGSWVFLGEILVDKEFPPNTALPAEKCGDPCSLCVTACPTKSLFAPYHSNPHICLSYITQMTGMIPKRWRRVLGQKLWGCDVCQQVCPTNKHAKCSTHPEFWPLRGTSLPLIPLLSISKREFREQFSLTPMYWRGKAIMQRNAAILLGNYRDAKTTDPLAECLQDPKPVLRASAAWALGEIGTARARMKLASARTHEEDPLVLQEIEDALTR